MLFCEMGNKIMIKTEPTQKTENQDAPGKNPEVKDAPVSGKPDSAPSNDAGKS